MDKNVVNEDSHTKTASGQENISVPTAPLESRFSAYEMTQYIIAALGLEDGAKTTNNHTFKMYGYGGSLKDLLVIIEDLAIAEGKIEKIVEVPRMAWGCGWVNASYGANTNLTYKEIDLFIERVHYLIYQMVISPGNARDVSTELPWIHVTEYGKKCIAEREILPYDSDGYLARIKACSQHDEWDIYYINQVLKCFNMGLYDAGIMLLGIEGEYLASRLICTYEDFLNTNEPAEKSAFDTVLSSCGGKISRQYSEYNNSVSRIKGNKDNSGNYKYPDLRALSPRMDISAQSAFMNYLRLTRNELAHPSSVKMDPSETMLLIVSFLKYFEIQNEFMDFYIRQS